MNRLISKWPTLALTLVPLLLIATFGVVVLVEGSAPETARAIDRVGESVSRKENFTVQQYLYATLYYRQSRGDSVTVGGWTAQQEGGPGTPVVVQFRFADDAGEHLAEWEVDLKTSRVTARSPAARELSWR